MKTRKPKSANPPSDDDLIAVSPFIVERAMTGISRALKGKHFGQGEADAYINRLLAEGAAEEAAEPITPLEEAQDLMYVAWEATDPEERIQLAEEALEVSADCADAFTLLGNEKAMSAAEARAYFEEGVRAGRRAIGEKAFEENAGMFWGILETRPYMRARAELAACLWVLGERKAAIDHIQDMLRLNPGDSQGNRYVLLYMLTEEEDDVAVGRLLDAYPDDAMTGWLYDKALWLIRRHAPPDEVLIALDDAITTNPFVPAYLLGRKAIPRKMPKGFAEGSEAEAGGYAKEAKGRWVVAVGALEHLRQAVARNKKPRKPRLL
jgi:tetratricopeptide (TPR) repeat protein